MSSFCLSPDFFQVENLLDENDQTCDLRKDNANTEKVVKSLNQVIKEAVDENRGLSNGNYDTLLRALYHTEQQLHNFEIRYGLGKSLYALLNIVQPIDRTGEQIGYLVASFALIFRCSDYYKLLCYDSIGSKLIPLLIDTCGLCLDGRIMAKYSPGMILATVTKILGMFCRLDERINHTLGNENLLYRLVDIIRNDISPSARVDGILAISVLALDDENRFFLSNSSDAMDGFIQIGEIDFDVTRNAALAVFSNISKLSDTHTQLAKYPGMFDLLLKFLVSEDGESESRAAGTIRNLSSSEGVRSKIVYHERFSILSALSLLMIGKNNDTAAERSAEAIKNLSFSADSIVQEALLNYPELLRSLGIAAYSDSEHIRSCVSTALSSFSNWCYHLMSSHERFIDILVDASMVPPSYFVDGYAYKISSSFLTQAIKPENKRSMLKNSRVLHGLTQLSRSKDAGARVNSKKAIDILASNKYINLY
uniref:Uncharacterized protein n=2 Tax=Corethron hystrix TaxID=216773 RepID=A0A7S1FNB7_9STRA|mmetsp:Transcript_18009/g.40925  ORF Transcript_18009/g.40925 Transcript_18009/m.40925 type:complete len:480 (+) Transcript_18009:121-1560(+)